ncbi:MAG: PKD domain-containing protein [Bacteroidota bacterium]
MKKIIVCVLLLAGCSDKYESLYNSAPAPGLSFNKDTVAIREKDYTNVNRSDNGRLVFYCKSPNTDLNLQLTDTSGKVHVKYRGEDVMNKGPLPVIDSVVVFCAGDTAGVYSIDCLLTDRLGKVSEKQLIIKCFSNQPATPSFFFIPIDNNQPQNWPYVFDASLSHKDNGNIVSYHYSINGQPIITNSPVMNYTFHARGTHDIGLFVTDDLGLNSDTIHHQLIIP